MVLNLMLYSARENFVWPETLCKICRHPYDKKAIKKGTRKTENMNIVISIVLFVLPILLFGIGLISPLTPSEGAPSWIDILIFAIIPIVICGLHFKIRKNIVIRIFIGLEALGIAIIGFFLLQFVFKTA